MRDEKSTYKVIFIEGYVNSTCSQCAQPMCGKFDTDDFDDPTGCIKTQCVNCGFKAHLEIPRKYEFELDAVWEGY